MLSKKSVLLPALLGLTVLPVAASSEGTSDAAKLPKEAELVGQERAYVSPIWYSPK